MIYLVVLGSIVIVVLAAVAAYLHWKLYRVNQERKRLQQERNEGLQKKQKRCLNSIFVLAKAMLEDQVTLTEASIRISVLLEAIQLPEHELAHYVAFTKLAEATSHIPILDEWKALSSADKARLDKERGQHEKEYQDFVCTAAKRLLSQRDNYNAHLLALQS